MKKITAYLPVALILMGACIHPHEPRAKDKTSLELENLKGKVKSVNSLVYTGYSQKPGSVTVINYNLNGNETYQFDSTDGLPASTVTTRYDSAGRLAEYTGKFGDKITLKSTFKYDEYGNNVDEQTYDAENKNTNYQKMMYTYFNKISKGEIRNSTDKSNVYIWKYEYDDKHFQTKASGYKNDTLIRYGLTRNDDKGNVLEEQWRNPADTCYLRTTYKYDSAGRKLEQMDYDKNGKNDEKSTYTYNDKGDKTSWVEEYYGDHPLSEKYKYEYVYDFQGNWIEMKYYVNDIFFSKEVRTIEYYK